MTITEALIRLTIDSDDTEKTGDTLDTLLASNAVADALRDIDLGSRLLRAEKVSPDVVLTIHDGMGTSWPKPPTMSETVLALSDREVLTHLRACGAKGAHGKALLAALREGANRGHRWELSEAVEFGQAWVGTRTDGVTSDWFIPAAELDVAEVTAHVFGMASVFSQLNDAAAKIDPREALRVELRLMRFVLDSEVRRYSERIESEMRWVASSVTALQGHNADSGEGHRLSGLGTEIAIAHEGRRAIQTALGALKHLAETQGFAWEELEHPR